MNKRFENIPSVVAIIVTRNRLDLLKQCLSAVRCQSRPPDELLVVNNESTDGTRDWLDSEQGLIVIHQENLGGAGGFHRGMKEAYSRGHDWFWLMDDDTIPRSDALAKMLGNPTASDPRVGFLANRVEWKDGSLHSMNAPNLDGGLGWLPKFDEWRAIRIVGSSFVGCLVARRAIQEVGLPYREMFIWLDDQEYTRRLSRRFFGYLLVDSIVLHATDANTGFTLDNIDSRSLWKIRHFVRNRFVILHLNHRGLSYWFRGFFLWLRTLWEFRGQKFSFQRAIWVSSLYGYLFFRPRPEFPAPKSDS